MTEEKLPFQPPEIEYVSESYVFKVPVTSRHLKNPWHLRLYAAQLVQKQIGDNEIQLTSLKVKQPRLTSKATAKLFKRVPEVRLYVTIKF